MSKHQLLHKKMQIRILCFVCFFSFITGAMAQDVRNDEQNTWPEEYFGGENMEAVQAISYGFKPWYANEDELPGGVAVIKPSGDESGKTDRNNIQDAINRMSEAGGGKVQLKEGKYYVNNQLEMESNVIFRGAGMDKTVVRNTRTEGGPASWNVVMPGVHHPAFYTKWKEDLFHKVKFGPVKAGETMFTIVDEEIEDAVMTKRNNREYWDKNKPEVGDMLMVNDYVFGLDNIQAYRPVTHHWTQFVKISDIDGYTVTIDEPFVRDLGSGLACWVPSPEPVNPRTNIHHGWVENCVIGDMEFENVAAMIYAMVGTRNTLLENIKVLKTRGPGVGIQIQGFYKSTMRGCHLEITGGRSLEVKDGSARVLIEGNKFVNVGSGSRRPSISTGESVFAIHIHNNEWHFKVAPHENTPMFFRVQQYGGSFRNNYIHSDEGAGLPEGASVFSFNGDGKLDLSQMEPTSIIFDHVDPNYEFYRPTGFMIWEGNRYEVNASSAYRFSGSGKKSHFKMKKVVIRNEDWTRSMLTGESAGIILDKYPDTSHEIIVVENVKNLKGQNTTWQATGPVSSFPRLTANRFIPEEMVSITTEADLADNPLINDPLVRIHGMIVKISGKRYTWDSLSKRWENLDGGDDIVPAGE